MHQFVNPLSLVTTYAPKPNDTIWKNLAIPFWRMAMYKIGVFVAAFLLTVFFTIPVTVVQGIVQFQNTGKLARANATDTKKTTHVIYILSVLPYIM